jgi:hypothetical protein
VDPRSRHFGLIRELKLRMEYIRVNKKTAIASWTRGDAYLFLLLHSGCLCTVVPHPLTQLSSYLGQHLSCEAFAALPLATSCNGYFATPRSRNSNLCLRCCGWNLMNIVCLSRESRWRRQNCCARHDGPWTEARINCGCGWQRKAAIYRSTCTYLI